MTTTWWIVGWVAGGAVVAVAAGLLVVIVVLARRVVRQADEIVVALDGARANTEPLVDVADVNEALDRIACGLAALGAPAERSGGLAGRIVGGRGAGGS